MPLIADFFIVALYTIVGVIVWRTVSTRRRRSRDHRDGDGAIAALLAGSSNGANHSGPSPSPSGHDSGHSGFDGSSHH